MNKKLRRKIFTISITLIITILLMWIVHVAYNNLPQTDEISISDLEYHWACMDGCYNMEEIMLGELDHSNETQKEYHRLCSDRCLDTIIPKE